MSRYKVERSQELPGWWVVTDVENGIVCRFEEHRHNETQKVTILDEERFLSGCSSEEASDRLAKVMREMGDYIATRHYCKAMPIPVYEFRVDDEQGKQFIIRHKSPIFTIELQDDCTADELSEALKGVASFVNEMGGRGNL